MLSHLLLVTFVICTGFQFVSAAKKNKPVSAALDAKWGSTPLLLETSEFLAHIDEQSYWGYINAIVDKKVSVEDLTEKEQHDIAIEVARQFISPLKLKLLKLSLSTREFSATVEMYNEIAGDRQLLPNCEAVVDVNGLLNCDVTELPDLITNARGSKHSYNYLPAPDVYKIDRFYPGSEGREIVAILYGELGTPSFQKFHETLRDFSTAGDITYIIRHYTKIDSNRKTRLSGYGVELDIKSTEYKAQDDTKVTDDGTKDAGDDEEDDDVQGFNFVKLRELYPELKQNLEKFKAHLLESDVEMAPLKVWQLQDLSFQAAQRILSVEPDEALHSLRTISQNFPTLARSLVKAKVSSQMRNEVLENQMNFMNYHSLEAGESALFLNGLQLDLEVTDIFHIQDVLRDELCILEGLWELGLRGDELVNVLRMDLKQEEYEYAVDIRNEAIYWINDIEKDSKYKDFNRGVHEILRPVMPGMLRNVRKNFYNLVFILDPSKKESRDLLSAAEGFYTNKAPLKIGLALVVNQSEEATGRTDASVAMLEAFNYIRQEKGLIKALNFLNEVWSRVEMERELEAVDIVKLFVYQYQMTDVEHIFAEKSQFLSNRKLGYAFLKKTGLGDDPQVLLNGVAIEETKISRDEFEEVVIGQMIMSTPEIQRAVYMGELSDNDDVLEWLMARENVVPRLNNRILQTDGSSYLQFHAPEDSGDIEYENFSRHQLTSALLKSMKYLIKKGEDDPYLRPITQWVVGDLDTQAGREQLIAAIRSLKHSNDVRVGVVHNPDKPRKPPSIITLAVQGAIEVLNGQHAKLFINKILKEENAVLIIKGKRKPADFEVGGMDTKALEDFLSQPSHSNLKIHQLFSSKVLSFAPGQRGIICNGRILGPFKSNEEFTEDDFSLLESFMYKSNAQKIRSKVKYMKITKEMGESFGSDLVMKIGSIVLSKQQVRMRHTVRYHATKHSAIMLPAQDLDAPAFDIVAIVDPASRGAQFFSHLLMVFRETLNANIKVLMNCREKLSEMPVKNYFRYVLQPGVQFTSSGEMTSGPIARFNNLPQNILLTLNMKVPESWLVESVRAIHDLDNIKLEETENGVMGEFELEYLLLEGHCHDKTTGQPPRGLQFTLGTKSQPVIVDTIVMANLGYFQLKAKPGAWILRIRDGRSADIYYIETHVGTDSPLNSSDVIVLMDSFKSKIIKVRVAKKPEMINEDLLKEKEDEHKEESLWSSLSSSFMSGTATDKKGEEDSKRVNIFSIASGHLYERLLRIMMLSVIKNSQSSIKFWFLKNYLSPQFKEFIPHMAKEYGFEYELVTYKWPRWLHQQTEKQRKIWGYKILFLDVLFPLDISKIIFVDADQVVRTDMQELVDLDLGGAPYGYTPFCDSRRDMDGYRFWKSGYWNSHLGHRKYHISALYVVDLKKFRKIAAGDRLRGQYQGLSQDPNSLSNLDQDLPNNMIHQVAIKSLPQEWLWCETWCDDDSKKYAKTIDLCNNPRTKEPKLVSAMRIIPEWVEYDNEIKELQEKVSLEASTKLEQDASDTDKSHKHIEL